MKRVLSISVFLALAVVLAMPPAAAQAYQATARRYDVQRLQDDLTVLEDSLAAVPTSHPRYREFRDRADALRQDLVQIRDDMGRSREDTSAGAVSLDEVDRVRDRVRTLQGDIDTALDRRFTRGSLDLPTGTELTVRLEQPLSSRTARLEDRFDATVARPVMVDSRVVIAAGTRVQGTVTRADQAQRPIRGGRLDLAFDRALLDDGTSLDLHARVVQVKEDIADAGTARNAGIGAALGGILGSIIGGTKGAIVGVLLGGAGGAITAQGDDVNLPEGTVFTLQLDRPVTVLRR